MGLFGSRDRKTPEGGELEEIARTRCAGAQEQDRTNAALQRPDDAIAILDADAELRAVKAAAEALAATPRLPADAGRHLAATLIKQQAEVRAAVVSSLELSAALAGNANFASVFRRVELPLEAGAREGDIQRQLRRLALLALTPADVQTALEACAAPAGAIADTERAARAEELGRRRGKAESVLARFSKEDADRLVRSFFCLWERNRSAALPCDALGVLLENSADVAALRRLGIRTATDDGRLFMPRPAAAGVSR